MNNPELNEARQNVIGSEHVQVQVMKALKRAYQKHTLHDESIGDDELSDEMAAALVAVLGDDGFFFWLESVCK